MQKLLLLNAMKISVTIGFLALGIVLASPNTQAQSSTNQASSNVQPQSGQETNTKSKKDRPKKAKRKRNRDNRSGDENNLTNSGGTTGQDSAYRGGSVSSGTTMNNSNVSNYNSQQVTTAPTGVGSTNGATSTVPASTGVSTSKGSESPNLNQRAGTGTGAAVAGAITTAPTVPNSAASPSTTVGDFTSAQPDYTTLQNALQSANLDKDLRGAGPFTVFAPSNGAFKKLPTSTQNTLLEGQNQEALKQLLQYHIVSGTVDAKELARQINAGSGKAQLKTMGGGMLTAQVGSNGRIILTDEMGKTAYIDTPDQIQANGVVHGITNVLMPRNSSFK